ncbi:hypothetical protein HOI83_02850 [Candidatus Uhrbacteria bacterium]|jgi:hypothetical protein|nr:hypothetical protein [Candidatus Uhrbacteria bacterium]
MSILSTIQRNFWRSALVFGVIAILVMGWMLRVPMTNAALDVPQVLTYQARLTDSNRITVDDGNLAMQFTLYDASSGGTCRYIAGGTCGTPAALIVPTVDGIFSVSLGAGSTNAFTDELFDTYPSLYLEVQIGGETLSPLRQITSAAYAMQAGDSDLLDSLDSDNNGCTAGCIVAADADGNVVITGDPQSSLAAEASLYINPATPASDEAIFGVANNGSAIFKIDEDGDIVRIGSTTITNTVNQNTFMVTNNTVTDSDLMVLSATSLTTGDALQITTGAGDSAINVAVGNVTFNDNLTVTGLTMLDGSSSTPDTAAGDGDLFVEDALEIDGLIDGDGTGENDFAGSITARAASAATTIGAAAINYAIGADGVTFTGSPSAEEFNSGVLGLITTTLTPSVGSVESIGGSFVAIDGSSGNTSSATANDVYGQYALASSALASTLDVTASLIGSYGWSQPGGSGDVTTAIGVLGRVDPDSACTGDCDIATAYGGRFSAGDEAGGSADFTNLYGVSGAASRTGSGTATNVVGGNFTSVGGSASTYGINLTADHTESAKLTNLSGITGAVEHSGGNTVTTMNGIDIAIDNTGGGTVTNGFGADITATNSSGTITTSLTGTRSRLVHSSGALTTGNGVVGSSTVSGTATGTNIFGGVFTANSTSSGGVTSLYGVSATAANSAGTDTNLYGVNSSAGTKVGGTTTDAFAVYGNGASLGTTTRAHGGYFIASGASTNYAIYAETGVVHIDDVASSSGSIGVPDIATASGELYVNNDAEVDGVFRADGNVDLGDATSDTITATGRFDSSLVPSADNTNALGTDALRWSDLYVNGGTIHIGATGTESSGGSVGNSGSDASISYASETLSFETDNGFAFDPDDDDSDEVTIGGGGNGTLSIVETTSTQGAGGLQGFNPAITNTSSTANWTTNMYQNFTRSGYSTGSVTNAGIYQDFGNAASAGDAVVTNFGIDLDMTDTSGAGTTVTNYGLRVGIDNTGGSGSYTDYAIYTGGGLVHIDDDGSPATPDIATAAGELFVSNDAEVDGVFRADGDVDLGDADTDTITATGRFDSSLVPSADDTYDLGMDSLRWRDAYIGAESVHLGTAVGDELMLSYNTTDNGLEFTVGAAGTIDFEISEEGHVGFSNTDAALDNTLTFTDTYDSVSGENLYRNGTLSTLTFSNNTTTAGTHSFSGYESVISASNIDDNTTVTGEKTTITLSGTAPVAVDEEILLGNDVRADVSDGTSKFSKAYLYYGSTTYNGGSTSGGWIGSNNNLQVTAGTITDARLFGGLIKANGGSITTAYGANLKIEDAGAGSITDAVGLNLEVTGATDDNFALYVGKGAVHIDGSLFSAGPATAPTFGDVATNSDGTLFVYGDTEIYNGALCVGGATTCASASASTAGEIYADGAINATDFDLAEMFNSNEYLVAGDIITVDGEENETIRRAQPGDIIMGAISTAPGLVLGWGGENQYPVALAGRVPVKVSDENGSIAIGDRVTLGTSSGIGMKATDAGEILGIAMQPSNGGANDAIVIFIQPQYWNGDPEEEVSVTEQVPSSVIQTNNVLAVSDNVISNIASLQGMNWSVDAEGVFTTEATYDLKTKGHQNKDVITHAVTGLENYITMAGTTVLDGKSAKIEFEKIDPEFNDVIEAGTMIFVNATMSNGSGNVYVTDKTMNGFTLHRESGTGTEIDWVVTAFRKGFAPEEDEEVVEEEEEIVDEVVDEPIEEPPVEEPVNEPIEDEPVDETPVEDEEPVEEPVVDEVVEETPAEEPAEEPVDEPVVEEVIDQDLLDAEVDLIEEVASPSEEDPVRNDEPEVEVVE